MLISMAAQAIGGTPVTEISSSAGFEASPVQGGFLDIANGALKDVSAAQGVATSAEAGYAAGVPGATLSKALVSSDRAQVAWSATVAVRNEVVSAYQTIMNMQF